MSGGWSGAPMGGYQPLPPEEAWARRARAMNCDNVIACPEMDRVLAEALLPPGEWFVSSPRSDSVIVWRGSPWMPSTRITDAWSVLEQVRARGWLISISAAADNGPGWSVQVKPRSQNLHHHLMAPTAPLAICRAALWAVTDEQWPTTAPMGPKQ